MDIRALALDTGGTVLDWHCGLVDEGARLGTAQGLAADWHALVNA